MQSDLEVLNIALPFFLGPVFAGWLTLWEDCSASTEVRDLRLLLFDSVFSLISNGSSEEGLGSPSDPCLSPLAWSVTGKYLASAVEKMVNIWQVNGKH